MSRQLQWSVLRAINSSDPQEEVNKMQYSVQLDVTKSGIPAELAIEKAVINTVIDEEEAHG